MLVCRAKRADGAVDPASGLHAPQKRRSSDSKGGGGMVSWNSIQVENLLYSGSRRDKSDK